MESVLHVLRDCPQATQIWIPLLDSAKLNSFFSADLVSWVELNLSSSFGVCYAKSWSFIYASASYLLWSWRYKEVFDVEFSRPGDPIGRVNTYASQIQGL